MVSLKNKMNIIFNKTHLKNGDESRITNHRPVSTNMVTVLSQFFEIISLRIWSQCGFRKDFFTESPLLIY